MRIELVYGTAESFIFAELSTQEFQIYQKNRVSKRNLVANSFKFTESQDKLLLAVSKNSSTPNIPIKPGFKDC